ncbi:hypothetical protein ACFLX6_00360 [Chloroflexota bacterium]
MDIKRTVEQEGEATALSKVVTTGAKRSLRDFYRHIITNNHDFGNMSPEQLSEITSKATFAIVMVYTPSTHGWEPPDLGIEVPSDFLSTILVHPHPYQQFVSALYFTEFWRLCMEEIERRGQTVPEMMAMLEYKEAQPWKEAERKALDYLSNISFEKRAYEAERYGLDWLAWLDRSIDETLLKLITPWYEYPSLDDYFKDSAKMSQAMQAMQRQFPKLEIGVVTEIAQESSLSPNEKEGIIKDIESECNLLVRCTAVRLFKYIEESIGEEPTILNQTFSDIEQILKIQGIAWKYGDGLLGTGFSGKDKERETRITAQEGLYKGMETWASRNVKDIIIAGLTGHLARSLIEITKHDLIDAIRKEKRHQKHQLTEMDYRGESLKLIQPNGSSTRVKSEKEGFDEGDESTLFLNRIPTSQLGPEQSLEESEGKALDLKRLGFNTGELTPRELLLLEEVSNAARKGYKKDSKEGLSLRQYWGKDYARKMKMLKRLEAKRKKP